MTKNITNVRNIKLKEEELRRKRENEEKKKLDTIQELQDLQIENNTLEEGAVCLEGFNIDEC